MHSCNALCQNVKSYLNQRLRFPNHRYRAIKKNHEITNQTYLKITFPFTWPLPDTRGRIYSPFLCLSCLSLSFWEFSSFPNLLLSVVSVCFSLYALVVSIFYRRPICSCKPCQLTQLYPHLSCGWYHTKKITFAHESLLCISLFFSHKTFVIYLLHCSLFLPTFWTKKMSKATCCHHFYSRSIYW